jgi:hypothetical protein
VWHVECFNKYITETELRGLKVYRSVMQRFSVSSPSPSREQCTCHPFSVHPAFPATHQSAGQAHKNASQIPTHSATVAVRSAVRTVTNPEQAAQLRIMGALVLRSIFQQEGSSIGIGSHLRHQPRYCCNLS